MDGHFQCLACLNDLECRLQFVQREFVGDELIDINLSLRDQVECSGEVVWSMMEHPNNPALVVMQFPGVYCDGASVFASAEKSDCAALAGNIDRFFPDIRKSHGLDDHIHTLAFRGQIPNRLFRIGYVENAYNLVGAHFLGFLKLEFIAADDNDPGTLQLGQSSEHQSYGPGSDDGHGVAHVDVSLFDTVDDAGQWFAQRRLPAGDVVGYLEQVLVDDPFGDADVLGISAIKELKVLAKAEPVDSAVEATIAGGRVRGDYAHPGLEVLNLASNALDHAGEFMAEWAGNLLDNPGMTTMIGFDVRAASQSHVDAHQDLVFVDLWDTGALQTHLLGAVIQNCSHGHKD
jgi:hypothetical protein